jgi:hypothetical protein
VIRSYPEEDVVPTKWIFAYDKQILERNTDAKDNVKEIAISIEWGEERARYGP